MKEPTTGRETLESPATNSFAVTPHDSNEVGEYLPRGIYVGAGGNIKMQLEGDTAAVTWVGVVTGTVLWVRPRIIYSTDTTASSIVAFY